MIVECVTYISLTCAQPRRPIPFSSIATESDVIELVIMHRELVRSLRDFRKRRGQIDDAEHKRIDGVYYRCIALRDRLGLYSDSMCSGR